MSVWCGRITAPSVSSRYYHCRHRHRHRRSLTSLFKHLTTAVTATKVIKASSNNGNSDTAPLSPTLQTLSSRQKEQISLYVGALLQWNQRMNLTAVTGEREVMTRHVEDSLAIIPPLQRSYLSRCCASSACDGLNVVDVGSGPGLPGLIFAIACPSWKVTLLESMHKRCLFLEHIVGVAGLSNVEILCERAEDVGQCLDFRELFDVAVARAVAEMRILAEYCLPLVRVGGLFVAAKGFDPREEVKSAEKAIQLMGASILEFCSGMLSQANAKARMEISCLSIQLEFRLRPFPPRRRIRYHVESHGPLGQRTAVICLKDRETPRKYPRQPGIPSKMPL